SATTDGRNIAHPQLQNRCAYRFFTGQCYRRSGGHRYSCTGNEVIRFTTSRMRFSIQMLSRGGHVRIERRLDGSIYVLIRIEPSVVASCPDRVRQRPLTFALPSTPSFSNQQHFSDCRVYSL